MALERTRQSEPQLPQPGDVLGGKYRVDRMIASGGMGAVFVATHEIIGGRVALKWLLSDAANDTEATLRLIREARAAVRVRHANVVDVYDVGEHEGSLFLVMELLEGETLGAMLKRRGALPVYEALDILLPTMRGVQAAHRNQVIHRDLKPNNIFLCSEEGSTDVTARVLDFGISKVLNPHGDPEQSLTQTGAVIGTPYYMAPEQLTDLPIDHRIDVYALGVILYQALSGRLPFVDTNYNALVVQIATAAPAPLSELRKDLPVGLEQVVAKAMARKPEARFDSVADMIAALVPFTQRGEIALAASASPAATRSARGIWLAALAFVALLLGWWWMQPKAPVLATPSAHDVERTPPTAATTAAVAPTPSPSPQPTPTLQPVAAPPISAAVAAPPPTRVRAKPARSKPAVGNDSTTPTARPVVDISADQF